MAVSNGFRDTSKRPSVRCRGIGRLQQGKAALCRLSIYALASMMADGHPDRAVCERGGALSKRTGDVTGGQFLASCYGDGLSQIVQDLAIDTFKRP